MKVVDLGSCRDFLRDWEDVKQQYLKGRLKGGAVLLLGIENRETVYLFGNMKDQPDVALSAAMRISMALNRRAAPIPQVEFKKSRF